MYVLINFQDNDKQAIFRYADLLDATVSYYNTVASNYSAYKAETIASFKTFLTDENLNMMYMASESR